MKPDEFLVLAHRQLRVAALLGLIGLLKQLLRIGPLRKGNEGEA
jgi:hypothetical protein